MITVIFASRNGAQVLERTLESLARARAPRGGWKLIAVDNASTDNTFEILKSFEARLPLTVLQEGVPGKNRSLNKALEIAQGDFYVFCDDDVIVAPDWLEAWRKAADEQTDFDLFAGSTLPHWPSETPDWVRAEVNQDLVFGTNSGLKEGPCEATAMYGTNMALRSEIFAKGVRFNPDIGPTSSASYPMGSETELARRLDALGYKAYACAGAVVEHIIRPSQMDREYTLLRAYRWGRGLAHMKVPHSYEPGVLSRKNVLRWLLYPLLLPVVTHKEAWARQWEWAIDQGYEYGWRETQGLEQRWRGSRSGPLVAARYRGSR